MARLLELLLAIVATMAAVTPARAGKSFLQTKQSKPEIGTPEWDTAMTNDPYTLVVIEAMQHPDIINEFAPELYWGQSWPAPKKLDGPTRMRLHFMENVL